MENFIFNRGPNSNCHRRTESVIFHSRAFATGTCTVLKRQTTISSSPNVLLRLAYRGSFQLNTNLASNIFNTESVNELRIRATTIFKCEYIKVHALFNIWWESKRDCAKLSRLAAKKKQKPSKANTESSFPFYIMVNRWRKRWGHFSVSKRLTKRMLCD